MNWIKCSDKLPDLTHKLTFDNGLGVDSYSDPVLAWCDDKLMVLSLQYGQFDEGYGLIWCNHFGNINETDPEWDEEYNPTHWMPLPSKPE